MAKNNPLPPKGDVDKDGIPNAKDPKPFVPGKTYDPIKQGGNPTDQNLNAGPPPTPTPPPVPSPTVPPAPEGYIYDPATGTYIKDPNYQPDKPTDPPAPGYEWTWNGSAWTQTKTAATVAGEQKYQNDLFAQYKLTLESFGITGADSFLRQAVKEDWNESTFLIKMRESDFYLANPLFAANLANAKKGKRFMAEGEVIGYATEAKRLARQFGYAEPSDNYIANGLAGGLSLAEYEHRFAVQQRVNQFGGGVAMVYEALMGSKPDDSDLYEIFDKEISTKAFDDAARAAEMRGRPMLIGLGIRSAEEQKALDLLGVSSDQAWSGYKQLADALPSVSKLAALDQNVKNDPSNPFDSFGALFNAIFQSGPQADAARRALAQLRINEQNRFKQGGVQAQQGQFVGLLSEEQKASYG